MSILAKNESGSGDFYRVPAGTYIARCYSVIDMGTYQTEYQGKPKQRHVVRITWEIPDEIIVRDDEERPASISKSYTLSLGDKATLRKHLEAWRGKPFSAEELKGFDVSKLLGAPCTLTVSEVVGQDGKARSTVAAVGKLGKGMVCKSQMNCSLEYSVSQGKDETWMGLSDWTKKQIETCLEWTHPAPVEADPPPPAAKAEEPESDDVPF